MWNSLPSSAVPSKTTEKFNALVQTISPVLCFLKDASELLLVVLMAHPNVFPFC